MDLFELVRLAVDVLGLSVREKRVIKQATDVLEDLEDNGGRYKVKNITAEGEGEFATITIKLKKV